MVRPVEESLTPVKNRKDLSNAKYYETIPSLPSRFNLVIPTSGEIAFWHYPVKNKTSA